MRYLVVMALSAGCFRRQCTDTEARQGPMVTVTDAAGDRARSALVSTRLRSEDTEFSPCLDVGDFFSCDNRDGVYDVEVRSPGFALTSAEVTVTGDGCSNRGFVAVALGSTCATWSGSAPSVIATVAGGPPPEGTTLTWSTAGFRHEPCSPGDVASFCAVDIVGPVTVELRDGEGHTLSFASVDIPMDGCDAVSQSVDLPRP